MRLTVRTVVCGLATLAVFSATPVSAQYQRYRPAAGASAETWHMEFSFGTWQPAPDLKISGAIGDVAGTVIDAKNDLGVQAKLLERYSLMLRPSKKFKFRFGYAPAAYSANVVMARSVLFAGQVYTAGSTVVTSVDWKTYRLGYEYDFISRSRGFAGFIMEARYDKASATIGNSLVAQTMRIRTPVPMLGGIVRVYPITYLSLTGEITGFTVPGRFAEKTNYDGNWLDLDLYATVNIGRNLGLRSGYRSTTVTYMWDLNQAHAVWKGPYATVVVRF
jgi:hypothetical protein